MPVEYEKNQLGTAILMWKDGEEYIQKLVQYLSWSIKEGFLIYRKPNGEYDGFLAQVAMDPIRYNPEQVMQPGSFTGLIVNADWNENILRSWRFLEGKIVEHYNPDTKQNPIKTGRIQECSTYYTTYSTVTGSSCGLNCQDVTYTQHTVPNTYCYDNGSNQGYTGSGGYDPCNWYGYCNGGMSSGGGGSTTTNYIKNQLQYPCLKNVFNNLLSTDFNNKVQQILLNFYTPSALNFTIKEEWMSSNTVNATTVGSTITLNLNALNNASQEFIARVIYHEVLHVYIGNIAFIDHTTMAAKYVAPMAQALMAWFPISLSDATALSWSGLQDTAAYEKLSPADRYNVFMTSKKHKNYNNEYNHQYGHSCP